jgi:hypothetical protein
LTICLQLTNAKKGNLSILDYYHQIKNTTTILAAAGQQISDAEFTSYLLSGLGLEYDSFVTSVATRVEPLSIDILFGHLLAHKSRIAKHHQEDSSFLTANVAAQSPNFNSGRDNH